MAGTVRIDDFVRTLKLGGQFEGAVGQLVRDRGPAGQARISGIVKEWETDQQGHQRAYATISTCPCSATPTRRR